MKGFISENSQWCSQGAQRQPQATRKKCNMTKQASTGLTYDRLHLHFCVIWGIKGLIYENAQGWSSGTLEHFEEATPSYKKQQRIKLHTKQASTQQH